jgi:hypothetical protein
VASIMRPSSTEPRSGLPPHVHVRTTSPEQHPGRADRAEGRPATSASAA